MTHGRPRHATSRDANQAEIVAGLEALGFYVLDVSPYAPIGCDLLVCGYHRKAYRPVLLMVEVKTEGGELTEREAEVRGDLAREFGLDAPYVVARCLEDVLEEFGARG